MQFGSYSIGPSTVGPRQTKQRDFYARYDSNTAYIVDHIFHFGGAVHRIVQGDYWNPGNFGPSVTSSNGLATISAIDGNPLLTGGAQDPLNYPVGTVTIYNGLGNFSTDSAFGHLGGHSDTRLEGYFGDTFNVVPNVNLSFGVNYVYDTNRNNRDLGPVPCSDLNILVTSAPCSGSDLILNQYGFFPPFSRGCFPAARQQSPQSVQQFRAPSRHRVGSRPQRAHGSARQRRPVLRQLPAPECLSGPHQPPHKRPIQSQPDALSGRRYALSQRDPAGTGWSTLHYELGRWSRHRHANLRTAARLDADPNGWRFSG